MVTGSPVVTSVSSTTVVAQPAPSAVMTAMVTARSGRITPGYAAVTRMRALAKAPTPTW